MEHFRNKTLDEISGQVTDVEREIGKNVVPDGETLERKLAEKYPRRYVEFLHAIRLLKRSDDREQIEYSEEIDNISSTFGILNNLREYVNDSYTGKEKILTPRQIETLIKISAFLENGMTEGHVTLPTGIGKTVIFARLLEILSKDNPLKCLVIGPTKIILNQNSWKLEEFGGLKSGKNYGGQKDLSQDVTVTTFASLRNGIETGKINPSEYDVLIIDEAHMALGEETMKAIESFRDDAIKIGFTATPEYHEEKTVGDILPYEIDYMTVREAIEDNLLAGLKVFVLPTQKNISQVDRTVADYNEADLVRLVNTPDRNKLIVDAYTDNELFNGKLAIAYCVTRDHARDLTQAFLDKNVSAAYIGGDLEDIEREKILRDYKLGDIKVLCNAKVLVQGFDESEAEVCINASPTMSKVVAEQRAGRVLRRSIKKDNKIGYVLEVYDNYGDSENTPVFFSEIVGAAEVMPKEKNKEIEEKEDIYKIKKEIKTRETKEKVDVEVKQDIIDDPDMVMKITNRNEKLRFVKMFEYAPRGWSYSRMLAHDLAVKEGKIREYVNEKRKEHPEWFVEYLTSTDILSEHFHPLLVTEIVKHFNPSFSNMTTVYEFADRNVLSPDKAENILTSLHTESGERAPSIGGVEFYPEKEYKEKIRLEASKSKSLEENEISTAEDEYWADESLSEEEKEKRYWEQFEPIVSDEVIAHDSELQDIQNEKVNNEFRDDTYFDALQSDYIDNLKNLDKTAVRKLLETLEPRERKAIEMYYFEDKNGREIGDMMNVGGSRVGQLIRIGMRKMKHPDNLNKVLRIGSEEEVANDEGYRMRRERYEKLKNAAMDTLIFFAKNFKEKIEDRFVHIGSSEKKYFDQFKAITDSLLSTDLDTFNLMIRKETVGKSEHESAITKIGRVKDILDTIEVRATLLKTEIETNSYRPFFSPDGVVARVYDPYWVQQEIIHMKKNNKDYSSDYYLTRITELDRYLKKLKKHFPVKE